MKLVSKFTRFLESIGAGDFQSHYSSVNGGTICLNSGLDHLFAIHGGKAMPCLVQNC